MTYVPTEWETGDIITAEKLNKAESGIVSASPFIITGDLDDEVEYDGQVCYTTDANYDELVDAIKSGRLVYLKWKTVEEGELDVSYILLNNFSIYDDPSSTSTIKGDDCNYFFAISGQSVEVTLTKYVYNIIKNSETEEHANCLATYTYTDANVTGTPVQ